MAGKKSSIGFERGDALADEAPSKMVSGAISAEERAFAEYMAHRHALGAKADKILGPLSALQQATQNELASLHGLHQRAELWKQQDKPKRRANTAGFEAYQTLDRLFDKWGVSTLYDLARHRAEASMIKAQSEIDLDEALMPAKRFKAKHPAFAADAESGELRIEGEGADAYRSE
jgi:hypothetical protein